MRFLDENGLGPFEQHPGTDRRKPTPLYEQLNKPSKENGATNNKEKVL